MPHSPEEGLLEIPGGLNLDLEEEEVGVGLQGNKSHVVNHGSYQQPTTNNRCPSTAAVMVM